ncbi:tyrosine-type recombinase/integrase [Streptomyces sp. NPDC048332]|uniref:tyrosine-type recombinase/integrase n=1 Tax=Streptomyces sp. NPDC048332 TaxID=3154619 RepID=UPI0034287983
MRTSAGRGRIYRRCGCRDTHRHQIGARCPHLLTDSTHGTWGFAVDVPAPGHHRTTVRRGGFASQDSAEEALRRFLEGEAGGFDADPNQTVAAYLDTWLAAKALVLKPTTMARYRDYVRNDLAPAFGTLKLDQLAHRHIAAFVTSQLAAGRGRTTLYRCLATLSSALGDAVRQHRLPHNPASPPALHRPPSPERRIWTAEEAARFLTHCHQTDPEMADLFEVLIGTGMRKGEALGLHWNDVHLDQGMLYIRCTLSAVDNQRLVLTTPKTRSSRGWVAISPRVATALRRHARSAPSLRGDPSDPFTGLVFCQPDGRPLGPHLVLDRLHRLSEEAGIPRVTVHDLATWPPPSPSPPASPSPWSPRRCGTPPCRPPRTSTATSPNKPHTRPSTPSTTSSAPPSKRSSVQTGPCGCDHHATTSTASAQPSTNSAPPHHPPPAPRRTSPGPGVRPHCDHHTPRRTKGRPLTDERTTSDLRLRMVGTTGFEPATP